MKQGRKPHRHSDRPAGKKPSGGGGGGGYWMYGLHACDAALQNPNRDIKRVLIISGLKDEWEHKLSHVAWEISDSATIARHAGEGAVHQGIAMQVLPLDEPYWDGLMQSGVRMIMLDQVTDPHNVGAILRSAAAFGVGAVIMTKDHSPPESGALAKAACGALELVPCIRITNLSQTLDDLKRHGYWIAGMDGQADKMVEAAGGYQPLCLVMGAEGAGLRRLTKERCDLLVKIPMDERMESLNVSNAAAIALYAMRKA